MTNDELKQYQDREQKHWDDESDKLDQLRLDHARLTAKVDFVETELREHKSFVSKSIADLNTKIDKLHERFDTVSDEVKTLATKIGIGAIFVGVLSQVLLKHFGFL